MTRTFPLKSFDRGSVGERAEVAHFEGHSASQRHVFGFVDGAHPAAAQLAHQLELIKRLHHLG